MTHAESTSPTFSLPKKILLGLGVLILVALGVLLYQNFFSQSANAAAESSPYETTSVQQGELIISALGSGTLVAADEIELASTARGNVTAIYVSAGDKVEAGDLLAEIESANAQEAYETANFNYEQLTSERGLASAQNALAEAEYALKRAKYQLEYLISPEVLYWEGEVAKAQAALDTASASERDTAQDKLDFMKMSLRDAWDLYEYEYIPSTFSHEVDEDGNVTYLAPTDLQIEIARTAIDEAQHALVDSQEYYIVLSGEPMPENTSNASLIQLDETKRAFDEAQAALKGTQLIAPSDGTILDVDAVVGDAVDTDPLITMADLSQLNVEIYLDSSDWDKIAVGNPAEVTFSVLEDETFNGEVTEVDSELYVSFNSSTIRGIVTLNDDEAPTLPIGASATVEVISAKAENAILIPLEAVHEIDPNVYGVFVLENDEPILKIVEIGIQDEIYVEIKSGIRPRDTIITGLSR